MLLVGGLTAGGCDGVLVDLRGEVEADDTGAAAGTQAPWAVEGEQVDQGIGAGGLRVLDRPDGGQVLVVAAPGSDAGAGALAVHEAPDEGGIVGFSQGLALVTGAEEEGAGAALLLLADPVVGAALVVGVPTARGGDWSRPGAVSLVPVAALDGGAALADRERGRLLGSEHDGGFGRALARADLDGDGRPELLVGAPGERYEAGRVWLFTAQDLALGVSAEDATTHARGDDAWDWLGTSLAAGGDVDGDGLADVVLGAPGFDTDGGHSEEGAAFVLSGAAWLAAEAASVRDLALARVDGGAPDDQLGLGPDSLVLDDLDGDGRADLAVGAPGADLGQDGGGAVGVFPADTLSGTPTLSQATLVLTGTGAAGTTVVRAEVGGTSLLLVGAPEDGLGGTLWGVPGDLAGRSTLEQAASHRLAGASAGDAVGRAAGQLVQLRPGTAPALAVPAPGGDGMAPGAGQVRVQDLADCAWKPSTP